DPQHRRQNAQIPRNRAASLDESLRLWRYMSFDRFVHLLATEELWLAPLSYMEDRREGTWIDVQPDKFQGRIKRSFDYAAAQTVVSSWIAAETEMLPMWDSYAPADTGMAISTDVYSLVRTLAGSSITDDAFYLMRVEYCDQPQPIPVTTQEPFWPPICAKYKSREFRHENEVRVVYSRSTQRAVRDVGVPIPFPDGGVGVIDYDSVDDTSGTYVEIKSIHALTKHGIYVSPRANRWMIESVKSVMGTYGHDPTLVRQSALTHLFQEPAPPPFKHNIVYEGNGVPGPFLNDRVDPVTLCGRPRPCATQRGNPSWHERVLGLNAYSTDSRRRG
ncbi:MAG: hypothetical protein OXJ36_18200, partial [bacterium]|nr:hypothetical protein [bacterium]MDE0440292.1 hypothetical protein [bacterium]